MKPKSDKMTVADGLSFLFLIAVMLVLYVILSPPAHAAAGSVSDEQVFLGMVYALVTAGFGLVIYVAVIVIGGTLARR